MLINTRYTRGLRSIHVDGYGIYYALRGIFGGRILIILCTTKYFRGVDTLYTMHYVIFSGVDTKGNWCILSKKLLAVYCQYTSIFTIILGAPLKYTENVGRCCTFRRRREGKQSSRVYSLAGCSHFY